MKNLSLLIVLSIALFSCSPNEENAPAEEEINFASSPIIVQYHSLSSTTGDISAKYYFDEDQRFTKYHKIGDGFTINYNYDGEKLVLIIKEDLNGNIIERKDVLYNANDKISFIGDRKFKYEANGNYYSESTSYVSVGPYMVGNLEELEYSYDKFYFQNGNPMPQYCYMSGYLQRNIETGVLTDTGACNNRWTANYSNNNVNTSYYNGIASEYYFDTNTNPMYNNTTNFKDILGFFSSEGNGPELQQLFIVSENNRTNIQWDTTGTENTTYSYTMNTLGLPEDSTAKDYNNGVLVNEYPFANYYYVGDVIPD
ncbi:hypothetical protein [Ulvibacter antarcticus]|uniref:YD repeat-containing protein n=1 Tax=Ulvibacter antarcticus TaxID=442714 RepID=A0A3L9Z1I2_9FLAO|nr:hypothetical protein [Ulvibacter antarcticus]RMA65877.1 hypothetical protein BXY75_0291 [Ulvibacter antarcticus]